ncbi:hypothetical protein [Hasllibacter sp. MH4015]|uniref:hypothetical protein n=1 Tax=Hasllibacter sp. MH4015 TaxID=2854029 RepID=UPI001CD461E9|nr:hypothetical protein [Hasllibacter sp. MH4015]
MIRLALLLLTFVVACAPQPGTLVADQTGLNGSFTAQIPISDHPHHVLMGHVIDTTRDGARVRALVIGARTDGVHRLHMREAWSNGIELPFRSTSRRLDGCTHGHCRDRALGIILLSDAMFAQVRQHGLRARLIGSAEPIDISVPASLFLALPEYREAPAN